MNEHSCKNCFKFVATIPRAKDGKILYARATARCKEGYLLKGNGTDHIVKNVLKPLVIKELQLFKTAERCPGYDTE